jgi:hypothetical protein
LARPPLIVAKKSGAVVSKDSMLKFCEGKSRALVAPRRRRFPCELLSGFYKI